MESITIEKLLENSSEKHFIADIRTEEYFREGALPGAINIPMDELETRIDEFPRDRKVYIYCHTGSRSQEYASVLEENGIKCIDIQGGYRAYLRLSLENSVKSDQQQRRADIERSIIKKFRKTIWRRFTQAVTDYKLINEGDKIAVCISGGKDSMLLAKLIQEIQKHGKVHFEAVFLVMNPGYNEDNWKIIQNNAEILGIPLTVFESQIFDVVADIDKNPCYLCARMRRGYLYSQAQQLGCNKIALGHHFDDVIETIMMGMLYSGKVETMMPKLHSTNFKGMELIRPMYLVKEEAIKAWRDYNSLHFIQCACRFTENCANCGGDRPSKRDEVKELIAELRQRSDVIDSNIFNCVQKIDLRKTIGYQLDDYVYNFLDDYDERG